MRVYICASVVLNVSQNVHNSLLQNIWRFKFLVYHTIFTVTVTNVVKRDARSLYGSYWVHRFSTIRTGYMARWCTINQFMSLSTVSWRSSKAAIGRIAIQMRLVGSLPFNYTSCNTYKWNHSGSHRQFSMTSLCPQKIKRIGTSSGTVISTAGCHTNAGTAIEMSRHCSKIKMAAMMQEA